MGHVPHYWGVGAGVHSGGCDRGPVITMARAGNDETASTHRCRRSPWPCSLVLRLTRTSGPRPVPDIDVVDLEGQRKRFTSRR